MIFVSCDTNDVRKRMICASTLQFYIDITLETTLYIQKIIGGNYGSKN